MKKILLSLITTFFCVITLAEQHIELAVPTVPGGPVDTTARAFSKVLQANDIPFTVTYHPGGNGDIAYNHVMGKNDNIILFLSSANLVFSHVSVNRDSLHAINMKLIGPFVSNDMVMIVPQGSQYISFEHLINSARKNEIPCGISNMHGEIQLKLINQTYSTKFVPVLYKGTGQLKPDILGGHIPCVYDQTAAYITLKDKLTWLATSGPTRTDNKIPTMNSVLPGYRFENYFAVAIPNGSNLLKDKKILSLIASWNKDEGAIKPLTDLGFVSVYSSKDLNQQVVKETHFYQNFVKSKK